MRHFIQYTFSLGLMLLTALPMQAQQEDGAFYIYQNDGHFDGFFYDQVQKISYSKLDTLGMEHEKYVSQEIVTADSTYRIMLSAIDSVGFVQPEIKFNPRLRNLREEGMLAYLTAKDKDALSLTFSSAMPENLRPHEGDVLIDFDFEDGFGGKVKSVSSGGSIFVECDPIESLNDVFQQFITVEQIDENKNGELIRRRTAGMPQATIDNRARLIAPFRANDDTFEGNIFNFGISGHVVLLDSSDVSITIDANINSAVTVKGSYRISTFGGYYISLTLQNDLDFGLGVTIDSKIDEMKERQTPFKASMPLPAAAPIFELRSVPGLFLKGDAHIKFGADLVKYRKRVWHKLEFNNDWIPSFNFGDSQLPELDDAIDNPWERDASLEFNGTIMAGIHGPVELGINSWLKKWIDASFGIHTYIGPKLSGVISLSLSNIYKDKFNVYNLFKDTRLSLQPCAFDYEATAELNTWLSGKKKVTLADGSTSLMSDISLYIFPDFNVDASVEYVSEQGSNVTAKVTPSRNIVWPAVIGIGIFEGNDLYASKYTNDYMNGLPPYTQFSSDWEKQKFYETTLSIRPGKYQVRPMFKLLGVFEFIGGPAKEIFVPGPYLSVSTDTLKIGCEGGVIEFDVDTNCDSLKIAFTSFGMNEYYMGAPTQVEYTCQRIGENLTRVSLTVPRYYGLRDSVMLHCMIDGYQKLQEDTYVKALGTKYVHIQQSPNVLFMPNEIEANLHDGDNFGYSSNSDFGGYEPIVVCTRNGNMMHIESKREVDNTWGDGRWQTHKVFELSFDIDLGSPETDGDYPNKYRMKNGKFDYHYTQKRPWAGNDQESENIKYSFKGELYDVVMYQGRCYLNKEYGYTRYSFDGSMGNGGQGTFTKSFESDKHGESNYYPNYTENGTLGESTSFILMFEEEN